MKTSKTKKPPRDIEPYDDSPLTKAELATARPLRDVFPELAEWSRKEKRRRARIDEAHKQAISIRLSPEVLSYFKRQGPGWQTRIDKALFAFVQASQ